MTDRAEDLAQLRRYADALADAVEAALPGWVERAVVVRWREGTGEDPAPSLLAAAAAAGEAARQAIMPPLRELLVTDVDQQRTNPLAVIRTAVRFPTEVLADAGLAPVERDDAARRLFPEDRYDLTPGAFSDLHPSVHEPGLEWGAAKAHVILRRRRHG